MRLEPADYRHLIDVEAERLAAIEPDSLGIPIPHIEGWTVHSIVGHTGWILRYVTRCLEAEPDAAPSRSAVGEPPVGPAVLDWYAEAVDAVELALDGADPDAVRSTWTGPQPVRWWLRRLSHELAMHRWDTQAATGRAEPIDGAQARDGIDEVLDVFVPNRLHFDALGGAGETIHLHATDGDDGEWLLELLADEVRCVHRHAIGDVAAEGTASDLMLLLWSRVEPEHLAVSGDVSLLHRWQAAAMF